MTILGLDIGEKRTGVAISNEVSSLCTPLEYISSKDNFLEKISNIIQEKKVEKIIIGLPKLLSGKEGERAKFSRSISHLIKSNHKSIKVILWDERLTTKQAEKYLLETISDKRKIKEKIDSVSAVLILENYLASKGRL
ncbi:MAG: Holliday junction resolvase RuvX [Dehalococcoidia bacterium]|mgnify:FL=1|nr:MAG: Holliday junction resolvase RuvX [Chloroflexota bacterium]|tara:strand:- start:7410 stop:7823 length:414 start_codon:yes stop_codon:yes gene_type:complete